MVKFKKDCIIRTVVLACISLFFLDITAYALRVPIKDYKRIEDNLVNIELVSPSDYSTYAEELSQIATKENISININQVLQKPPKRQPVTKIWKEKDSGDTLLEIINSLESNPHPILALFIAHDIEGKVLGVKLLSKPRDSNGATTVKGVDFVIKTHRHKGIGIKLRKEALLWLAKNNHPIYEVVVEASDTISINNFKKVCQELNLELEPILTPLDNNLFKYYFIRLENLIKTLKLQKSSDRKIVKGPFRVTGIDEIFYIRTVTQQEEMYQIAQKFTDSYKGNELDFDFDVWKNDLRYYPKGTMVVAESKEGQILGIALHHKIINFMLSQDKETLFEEKATLYYGTHMETAPGYRDKGIGTKVMAKRLECAMNDSDIKDIVFICRPKEKGAKTADDFFSNRLKAKQIHIVRDNETLDLDLDDGFEFDTRHYIFDRKDCERIIDEALKETLPEQLSLFEEPSENLMRIRNLSSDI